MTKHLLVGGNFAVAVVGIIIGIFFLHKAITLRAKMDRTTLNMFIAIGTGAFAGSFHRIYSLPIYTFWATDNRWWHYTARGLAWLVILLLVISAWAYILHLKPVFYWIKYKWWLLVSLLVVLVLTGLGSLLPTVVETLSQ